MGVSAIHCMKLVTKWELMVRIWDVDSTGIGRVYGSKGRGYWFWESFREVE